MEQVYQSYEYKDPKVVKEAIFTGSKAYAKAPQLEGVPTGIKGLDDLFFTVKEVNGKLKRVKLNGIPKYSVFNITGVSDTGKSLMVEQFTIARAAQNDKVLFITVESPANFVAAGLAARAAAMGYEFKNLEDNIVLIDAASYSSLRENLPDLLATIAYAIKQFKINYTVIDSVTGFYEHKEMLARSVVRRLFNFMKKWYQTALFVSQKRSGHELQTAEAAGGYAVGHIVDGTMVLAKEVIDTTFKARQYGLPIGEVVRLFRIDGCRMAGHDSRTHLMRITESGLVEILKPLSELKQQTA